MHGLSSCGGRCGCRGKPKTAYQHFFTLEEADPDIPILKQAKAGYAKLQ
jgi:hypothetical protein